MWSGTPVRCLLIFFREHSLPKKKPRPKAWQVIHVYLSLLRSQKKPALQPVVRTHADNLP
jgi:hypothetical protein